MSAKKEWQKRNPPEMLRLKRLNATRDKAKHRDSYLRLKYKITLSRYDELLRSQKNRCAICRQRPEKRRLAVDHDHATGAVRGLLCDNCNTMLGFAKDTTDILLRAVRYLLFS